MWNKTLYEMIEDGVDLFSALTLPDGVEWIAFKEAALLRSGTLCPFIQNADILRAQMIAWSAYRLPDWQRMLRALTEDYNPIYNYFREELGGEEIAHHKGTRRSTGFKETETPGVSITNTGSVVAYDTYAEAETGKSVQTPTGINTREGLASENYVEERDIDATTYDRDEHMYKNRVTQGNIGVTQSVDLIKNEIELRTRSFLDILAMEFEDKFLVQIY